METLTTIPNVTGLNGPTNNGLMEAWLLLGNALCFHTISNICCRNEVTNN